MLHRHGLGRKRVCNPQPPLQRRNIPTRQGLCESAGKHAHPGEQEQALFEDLPKLHRKPTDGKCGVA